MGTKNSRGFTIVEIAVAVAIVGILVALVTFSFNAAVDNARKTTLKADLAESASNLKKERVDNGSYPTTQAAAEKFLAKSDGVDMQYSYLSGSSTYCLLGSIEGLRYHIVPTRTEAVEGECLPDTPGGGSATLNVPVISSVTVSGGQASVSWSGVTGATGYDVRRSVGSSGQWTNLGVVGATNTTITNLASGNMYTFQVRSKNSVTQSGWSASVQRAVPPTPTITSATSLGCGNGYTGQLAWFDANITWTATSSSITKSYQLHGDTGVTYGQSPKTVTNTGSGSLTSKVSTTRWNVGAAGSGVIYLYGVGPNGEKSAAATWKTAQQPAYYC